MKILSRKKKSAFIGIMKIYEAKEEKMFQFILVSLNNN